MKQMNDDILGIIHGKFANLVKLYQEMERKPRKYGTDEYLTGSEIHLIELIGDNNERDSVSDLARISNVTKGAISQNLKRLERKGLTEKEEDPANSSRSIVTLTSKGKAAYYAHRHWHERMDGGYLSYLEKLSDSEKQFVLSFMTRVETFFKSILLSEG